MQRMQGTGKIIGIITMIFIDNGVIIEENSPEEFFQNPKEERTRMFLSKVLNK